MMMMTVSYGSSFFSVRFMARALRAWAINRGGKNSVLNLRYGPRTRLVRGMNKTVTITAKKEAKTLDRYLISFN